MTGFKKTKAYSHSEKIVLCRLINKYKSKIDNKNNDSKSLAEKKKNWEMLAIEFNSFPSHTKRTVTQLKKLWENIMYRKKLEMARGKITRTTRVCTSSNLNEHDSTDPLSDHPAHFLISEQCNQREDSEEKPITPISIIKSEFQNMTEDDINNMGTNPFNEHDKELHMLKVKEQELKVILVEETIKNNRIIFELKKRKLEMEIGILSKE